MTILRWLWVSWYTIPYLLFMLAWGGLSDIRFVEGRLVAKAKRLIGFKSTAGQTVGMVLLTVQGASKSTYNHEWTHTEQALHWGPLWPAAYFLSIGWRRLVHEDNWYHAYRTSRYEREAELFRYVLAPGYEEYDVRTK